MIGIDLVCLTDPLLKNRTQAHLRFVVHPNDFYSKISDQNLQYHTLWTVKEAIFKAQRKQQTFDPKSIEVSIRNNHFTTSNFHGIIVYHESYILAICHDPSVSPVYAVFPVTTADSSAEIRKQFTRNFQPNAVKISSDEYGLPQFRVNDTGELLPVSFTHHHRFMAFAYPAAPKP